MQEKSIKLLVFTNGTGSKYYRLIPQLEQMKKAGHKVMLVRHDEPQPFEKMLWADVVIFQMVLTSEYLNFAKKHGKKVVFECDDMLHVVPKGHYSYRELQGLKRIKYIWKLFNIFRKCDGFISTNQHLNRIYGILAKKRLIFPNYCDFNHWLREYKPNTTDKVRILWAGSTSHTPDLEWIKPVMKRILEKYKDKVQFIYIGHGGIKSNDKEASFVYGDDLFEGLPDNRESMLSMPGWAWPHTLASLQADIAIAPLKENYFNKFKSQCKFLEYSINKIPAIYAKWFYTDIIEGETGLTASTPEEWYRKLCYLIENAEERKRLGENAYQEVLNNHNASNYLETWQEFIESL